MTFNELPKSIQKQYPELKNKPYQYEIVDGIVRFKSNAVIEWLVNMGKIDLNTIAVTFKRKDIESMKEFYRLMGYSVCGYWEIFGDNI